MAFVRFGLGLVKCSANTQSASNHITHFEQRKNITKSQNIVIIIYPRMAIYLLRVAKTFTFNLHVHFTGVYANGFAVHSFVWYSHASWCFIFSVCQGCWYFACVCYFLSRSLSLLSSSLFCSFANPSR